MITPQQKACNTPESSQLQVDERTDFCAQKLLSANAELAAQFQTGFQFGTLPEHNRRKQKNPCARERMGFRESYFKP